MTVNFQTASILIQDKSSQQWEWEVGLKYEFFFATNSYFCKGKLHCKFLLYHYKYRKIKE